METENQCTELWEERNNKSKEEDHGAVDAETPSSPALPVELLVLVASFLAGNDHYGTLANFSATCTAVRDEALSVLCETVILGWKFLGKGSAVEKFFGREGKHTRHLVILGHHPEPSTRCLFPNLTIDIWSSFCYTLNTTRARVNPVWVTIHDAVEASLVDRLIGKAVHGITRPGEQSYSSTMMMDPPSTLLPAVTTVQVKAQGRIVQLEQGQQCPPPWLLWNWARLNFLESACDVMVAGDATESLRQTMRYLYRGIAAPGSEMANHQIHGLIAFALGKSVLVYDAFLATLGDLLQRCPNNATLHVHVERSQFTIDDIKTMMTTLSAIYKAHWSTIVQAGTIKDELMVVRVDSGRPRLFGPFWVTMKLVREGRESGRPNGIGFELSLLGGDGVFPRLEESYRPWLEAPEQWIRCCQGPTLEV